MVCHPKTFLFGDTVRVRVLKSTPLRRVLGFRVFVQKSFMPQNTFPLILDAWLPVERRGDHVDKFSDEKFSFFGVANKQT